MSKIINYSSALTTNVSSYIGITGSITNIYGANSGITSSANTTQYATIAPSSTSSSGYAIYRFDTSEIPHNATINSVFCTARGRTSNNSGVRGSFQLAAGNTVKGSPIFFTSTTSTGYSPTAGTWNYNEIQDVRLRVGAIRTSNNNRNIRFYGATLTVNYTVNGIAYEVTVTNNSEATVSPTYFSGSGENCVITFNGIESSNDIIVTDNNVDVTSQLTYHSSISRSVSLIPTQLDSSNGTVSNTQNGLSDTASNTYAQVEAGTNYYLMYAFDVSSIPSNATINSVACAAKVENTHTRTNYGSVQLYAGSTAKGNATTFRTVGVVNLTTGTWTRSELDNIKIRVGSTYTGTNTYYSRFYGAELTVNYTVNEVSYTYTISNISSDHTIVVEDASVTKYTVNASSTHTGATVSPSTQEVREGRNATVTVSVQNLYEINITDNGVDVKNSLVGSNGTYTYTITNIQTAHTISVSEATYYNLVASSSHDTATISPATMKAYQGQNAVFTINGNVSDLILKDNGIDVTSSISNGSYTITNVTAVHTLTILNKPADFVKIDGSYKKVEKVFKKIDGAWVEINKTAFDDFVSTNIMMYGGNISISEIGNVETNGDVVNININNNALSTGTYKLIYENEHREPLDNVDKITEFTI